MADKDIERLRKITLGTIKAKPDIEELIKAPSKRIELCDIFGVATRVKPGTTDMGPYVGFLGSFRAVRLADRQIFESSKIILPKFIEEELFAAFGDAMSSNVEFAFRISAKYDKDAATKYVYDMRSLVPVQENAQLTALLGKVKDAQKALAAPKG